MVAHSTLTGADLHEPKGVASANSGEVYVADGSSSGAWEKLSADNVLVSDPNGVFTATNVETVLYEIYRTENLIEYAFDDISNPSTVLVPIPFSCEVMEITFLLAGAITTANSTVTVTRSDGAAMGTQVITFSGSAEGTAFTFTPSGNEDITFPTHRYVKLVTDGASSTSTKCYIQVRIKRT
jgi:hypothetical protein